MPSRARTGNKIPFNRLIKDQVAIFSANEVDAVKVIRKPQRKAPPWELRGLEQAMQATKPLPLKHPEK